MKKRTALLVASASLLLMASQTQSEPKRLDPRYEDVIAAQIKHRIDFILTPSDFIRNDPEIVTNVILPALGLASYEHSDNN